MNYPVKTVKTRYGSYVASTFSSSLLLKANRKGEMFACCSPQFSKKKKTKILIVTAWFKLILYGNAATCKKRVESRKKKTLYTENLYVYGVQLLYYYIAHIN